MCDIQSSKCLLYTIGYLFLIISLIIFSVLNFVTVNYINIAVVRYYKLSHNNFNYESLKKIIDFIPNTFDIDGFVNIKKINLNNIINFNEKIFEIN